MLPEKKSDFPKCLYLDQNKWIDLARAHYGRPDGERFQDALRAVRAAVEAGTLLVPFSLVNALEAMTNRDAERRRRLADFMVDLSGNWSILPHMTVSPWEIRNALRAMFTDRQLLRIRRSIVSQGLATAFGKEVKVAGGSAAVEAQALEFARSPEMSVNLLVAAGDNRVQAEQARKADEWIAAHCEQVRKRAAADLTPHQRRGVELALLFSKGEEGKAFVQGLNELGVAQETFWAHVNTAEKFNAFVQLAPTVAVFLGLMLARDQDLVRPIQANDFRDLLWLSVAVPYCNAVVSENYWGHMVRAGHLDARYGTALLTDARDLPALLADLGCI